jgi:hypothetical protein
MFIFMVLNAWLLFGCPKSLSCVQSNLYESSRHESETCHRGLTLKRLKTLKRISQANSVGGPANLHSQCSTDQNEWYPKPRGTLASW